MLYVDYIYEIVKNKSKDFDAIYQDYILELVGVIGLQALVESDLLEGCGSVNGRQLYVLCEKK